MDQKYSKEYQDLFVSTLISKPGFFLDIGMGDPKNGNNSYYLELLGWSGLMFDQTQKDVDLANEIRKNKAIQCDATNFNWLQCFNINNVPKVIDYISLDVDDANIHVINNLPLDQYEFKIMTFEHDRYNSGDIRKNELNKVLAKYPQYIVLLNNAKITGLEWEDWVINTKYFDMEKLSVFKKESVEVGDYVKGLIQYYKFHNI